MPTSPAVVGSLVQSRTLCWAIAPNQGLAVWREGKLAWEYCIRYRTSSRTVVAAAGEHSALCVLRSTGEIEYVDSLGEVRIIGKTGPVKVKQTIVAMPEEVILEAAHQSTRYPVIRARRWRMEDAHQNSGQYADVGILDLRIGMFDSRDDGDRPVAGCEGGLGLVSVRSGRTIVGEDDECALFRGCQLC